MPIQPFATRFLIPLLLLMLALNMSPIASTLARAKTGRITEYRLPKGYAGPSAITAGPDGNLWFTNVVPGGVTAIARMTPTGNISEYSLPACDGPATSITVGSDGNIWAMACFTLTLVRIQPSTGQMTTFHFQYYNYSGESLTAGPDSNLWLLETPGNNTIDRFSLSDHSLTSFPIPSQNAQAYGLTSGADGNLWFTESQTGKIGRLNPKTGQIREFRLPYNGGPATIISGPRGDQHLWFVENQGLIGYINPWTGQITQILTPVGSTGPGLSAGPAGTLWFIAANQGTYSIGRATLGADVSFTNFLIPTKNSAPSAITSGPDGNMWFTESNTNKIGKITTR